MQVLKESASGWLSTVNKKIKSLKAEGAEVQEAENTEVQESLLTEWKNFSDYKNKADSDDIFNKVVKGAYFATNDANRSRYVIKNIYTVDGEDWATFHSVHAHATEYAVLVSELERAQADHRIIILTAEDIANLKNNHGGKPIGFKKTTKSGLASLADNDGILRVNASNKEYVADYINELVGKDATIDMTGKHEMFDNVAKFASLNAHNGDDCTIIGAKEDNDDNIVVDIQFSYDDTYSSVPIEILEIDLR